MRKTLLGLVAALVLIGAGVGGTLGVQHFTGGDSSECAQMNAEISDLFRTFEGKRIGAPQATYVNELLDIRHKVCSE